MGTKKISRYIKKNRSYKQRGGGDGLEAIFIQGIISTIDNATHLAQIIYGYTASEKNAKKAADKAAETASKINGKTLQDIAEAGAQATANVMKTTSKYNYIISYTHKHIFTDTDTKKFSNFLTSSKKKAKQAAEKKVKEELKKLNKNKENLSYDEAVRLVTEAATSGAEAGSEITKKTFTYTHTMEVEATAGPKTVSTHGSEGQQGQQPQQQGPPQGPPQQGPPQGPQGQGPPQGPQEQPQQIRTKDTYINELLLETDKNEGSKVIKFYNKYYKYLVRNENYTGVNSLVTNDGFLKILTQPDEMVGGSFLKKLPFVNRSINTGSALDYRGSFDRTIGSGYAPTQHIKSKKLFLKIFLRKSTYELYAVFMNAGIRENLIDDFLKKYFSNFFVWMLNKNLPSLFNYSQFYIYIADNLNDVLSKKFPTTTTTTTNDNPTVNENNSLLFNSLNRKILNYIIYCYRDIKSIENAIRGKETSKIQETVNALLLRRYDKQVEKKETNSAEEENESLKFALTQIFGVETSLDARKKIKEIDSIIDLMTIETFQAKFEEITTKLKNVTLNKDTITYKLPQNILEKLAEATKVANEKEEATIPAPSPTPPPPPSSSPPTPPPPPSSSPPSSSPPSSSPPPSSPPPPTSPTQ